MSSPARASQKQVQRVWLGGYGMEFDSLSVAVFGCTHLQTNKPYPIILHESDDLEYSREILTRILKFTFDS